MADDKYIDAKVDAAIAGVAAAVRVDFARLESLIRAQPGLGWLLGIALAIVAAIIAIMQYSGKN